MDGDIGTAVRALPAWREKEDLLASVPGVGPIISCTLIAEMPELGSLDRKEIAGLAPYTRQSGTWQGKSFIGDGRTRVRTALFIGAMAAKRWNPPFESLLRSPRCCRQAKEGRPHRRRAKTPHHPQRHSQQQKPMAKRLAGKTGAFQPICRVNAIMLPHAATNQTHDEIYIADPHISCWPPGGGRCQHHPGRIDRPRDIIKRLGIVTDRQQGHCHAPAARRAATAGIHDLARGPGQPQRSGRCLLV